MYKNVSSAKQNRYRSTLRPCACGNTRKKPHLIEANNKERLSRKSIAAASTAAYGPTNSSCSGAAHAAPVPRRPAGFLAEGSAKPAAFPSGCPVAFKDGLLPRHSDEIARDLHPFPFYPLPLCRAQCKGTVRFSFNCNSIIAKAMQVRKHFLRVSERSFWGARPRL